VAYGAPSPKTSVADGFRVRIGRPVTIGARRNFTPLLRCIIFVASSEPHL
jgi:hypothetical protein